MASYSQKYGGVIWTNHVLERLGQRGLTQERAWEAFSHPDRTIPGKNPGSTEYQKHFGPSLVTVIAKQNERHEWILISAWIDPPLPGTEDEKKQQAYRKYQKSSFWGKLWMTVRRQLGLGY